MQPNDYAFVLMVGNQFSEQKKKVFHATNIFPA